jgi:hypothetical protein
MMAFSGHDSAGLRRVVLVSVVLVAACTAVVLAAASSGGAQGGPVESIDDKTKDTLAIFARSQTPDDRVPLDPSADAILEHPENGAPGENLRLSRRSHTAAGPVYIWPKREGACYSIKNMSGCADTDDLAADGVTVGVLLGKGWVTVNGLARNGIATVTIEMRNGSRVATPVTGNAFGRDVVGTPVRLRWSDNEGEHSLPVIVPEPPSTEAEVGRTLGD